MQVIGAGLPRTGTASFTEALRILLNGPVYHGGTQMTLGPESDVTSWIKILPLTVDNAKSEEDRRKMLEMMRGRLDGYVACTDTPTCGLVPELLELYPEAKVVVTTRDPASWEHSMSRIASAATLRFLRIVMMPLPTMRYFADYINHVRVQYLSLYGEQEPLSQDVYHKHMAWLKDTVPTDQLVFFDVKDGWEPLCKALGKDVPNVPFPQLNDGEAIDRLAANLFKKGLQRWAVIIGVVSTFTGSVLWQLKGRL